MEKKNKKRMRTLEKVLIVLNTFFCAWIVISYADVLLHQLSGGTDAAWNLFVIIAA